MRLQEKPIVGQRIRYSGSSVFNIINSIEKGTVFVVEGTNFSSDVYINPHMNKYWGLNAPCYWSDFEYTLRNDRAAL